MSILRGIVILTCVLSAARALPQISKKVSVTRTKNNCSKKNKLLRILFFLITQQVSGKDKHEDIHQVAKYLDVSYILGNHSCRKKTKKMLHYQKTIQMTQIIFLW